MAGSATIINQKLKILKRWFGPLKHPPFSPSPSAFPFVPYHLLPNPILPSPPPSHPLSLFLLSHPLMSFPLPSSIVPTPTP